MQCEIIMRCRGATEHTATVRSSLKTGTLLVSPSPARWVARPRWTLLCQAQENLTPDHRCECKVPAQCWRLFSLSPACGAEMACRPIRTRRSDTGSIALPLPLSRTPAPRRGFCYCIQVAPVNRRSSGHTWGCPPSLRLRSAATGSPPGSLRARR